MLNFTSDREELKRRFENNKQEGEFIDMMFDFLANENFNDGKVNPFLMLKKHKLINDKLKTIAHMDDLEIPDEEEVKIAIEKLDKVIEFIDTL